LKDAAGRPTLAVVAATHADTARSSALARQLELPLLPAARSPLAFAGDYKAVLLVAGDRLALQSLQPASGTGRRGTGALPGPVAVDFGGAAMRHRRRSGQNEMLGRAVGVTARRRPRVLDATAGLGRDGFILADMGCVVTLCERAPVFAAMLEWELRRARASDDDWLSAVARRLHLFAGDARLCPPDGAAPTDVICLDPMFPSRTRRAAVKKEMALFQLLLGNELAAQDADELLRWALEQDVSRVVVKRPPRAQYLAAIKPSHQIAGKAVRFDVYVRRALD
jgi:16S rRNA (guanine1516-N2)-methyltransferase